MNNQNGFTLVELLVTIMVCGVLVSSLSVAVANNSHLQERGRDVAVANSYAENKVEELRSKGYTALTNGSTDITSELPTELVRPRSGSVVISTYATGLKQVVVNVTYNDQGRARSYSYTTLIGELGVGQY